MIITVNPALAKLPFSKFKEWHKKFLSYDSMTAEERYKDLGGKVPVKAPDKEK